MKRMLYVAAAFAVLGFSGCEQSDLEPKMDVHIYLDETNTYLLGDPVRFVFKGTVDYVAIWTGDATHEYRYKNRTERPVEDIASAQLEMGIMGQYGSYGSLKIGVSDQFGGLTGPSDAANGKPGTRDKEAITAFGDVGTGWSSINYEQYDIAANNAKTMTFTTDVTEWAGNFSLAMHWKTPTNTTTQRTYNVTPVITVKYKDNFPDVTLNATDLGLTALSMVDERAEDVYDIGKTTSNDGAVCYTSFTAPIFMKGCSAWNPETKAGLPYAIDSWCISKPMGLNRVTPDKGVNIKTLSTDLPTYEYTYTQAGTYTVTFVVSSGNYQGSTGQKTVDFNITIIDPL